ncbi:Hypothetical predicted protein, partial [Paramuricea clavata]
MSSEESRSKSINKMSVTELKEYLANRGVSVSGYLKPALVEIATAVNKMMLPLNPNFEEKNTLENEKFYIDDMEIRNPFTSQHKLVNNFSNSPPFGLYDIYNYLIHHSTEYDKQGLAAYKSLDEYRLFQDGYVESLLTETLSNERLHLYMGKVKPAMKDKTDEGKRTMTAGLYLKAVHIFFGNKWLRNPAILPLLAKLYGNPNCPIIKNDIENDDVINLNESGNKLTSANGILKEKVNMLCEQLGPECHAEAAINDVLTNLSHSQEEVDHVNELTIEQWKCDEWYKQKEGFLTGSIAHRVL